MATRSSDRRNIQRAVTVKKRVATKSMKPAATEPQLWANLQATAEQSIAFWESFLDLRKAGNASLSSADRENLLRIVRAVCWVESKHGTSGPNQPKRDPMQIGNPGDMGWKQFAGVFTQKDRYVRGPSFPSSNYWADELPAAAAKQASFPSNAKLSSLSDATAGHQDAAFNATLSLYWGVPHLVFKTNKQAAGRPAYQFATLSRAELVTGAVKYNGGGDPAYEAKIEQALADQGWPSMLEMEADATQQVPRTQELQLLRDVYQGISREAFADLRGEPFADGVNYFKFKFDLTGVGSIEVELSCKPKVLDARADAGGVCETDDVLFADRNLLASAVGDLDLSGAAKTGAESLKTQFGALLVFTSGRRSVASQAGAMANNIVNVAKDRKWIAKAYEASAERTELQNWMDNNPQATSVAQIETGLAGIMNGWDDSRRAKISRHFAGLAFDLVPVRGAQEQKIVKAIKALPSFRKFLDGESGVDVWHVEFT